MLIFELAFLLLAILSVRPTHKPLGGESRWERVAQLLPLSPAQQCVRVTAHLSLWVVLFASLRAETLGEIYLMSFLWATITAVFAVIFLAQVQLARRRLLKAQVISSGRTRAIAQSKKLLKLLLCCTVILVAWYPFLVNSLFDESNKAYRDRPKDVVQHEVSFGTVLVISLFDLVLLAVVAVAFQFFLVPEPGDKAHRTTTTPTDTRTLSHSPSHSTVSTHV
eukprot:TRINITY_DN1306_c0_g1_i3.p1 TRINITY_DN1306_c0_g1~~TRINITY_DN1306_c0_g1_i3.p1  ORF type:complete len:222 (+),score=40.88 TRINITY_DN1306_c0_g1_i3:393-1058(+)